MNMSILVEVNVEGTARTNNHKVDMNLVRMGSLILEMLNIHVVLAQN